MATVADRIAARMSPRLKSKLIDLTGLRHARTAAEALQPLLSKGNDPGHAHYVFGQNFASIVSEELSQLKEARAYVKIVGDAEDEYTPGGPPISPLTASYFTMWAMFDVLFGHRGETMGEAIVRIAPLIDTPPWLLDVVVAMRHSTMDVHVHCGTEGGLVRLRALGSPEVKRCLSTAGYMGRPGELWFVRVLPPATPQLDYHVVFNTPYVLVGVTEPMFAAYLAREIGRLGSRPLPPGMTPSACLMKHGRNPYQWHEYVFSGYHGHQHDAVFLTGIPDIKASLPHTTPPMSPSVRARLAG